MHLSAHVSEPSERDLARLTTPLGTLPPSEARRVFLDIQQSAHACFDRPPEPRLTAVRNELKKALTALQRDAPPPHLSGAAWLYIGEEPERRDLAGYDRDRATQLLTAAYNTVVADIASANLSAGGRPPNERLRAFVMGLAQMFRRHTGTRPTYQSDDGELAGRFGTFVQEACRLFYRGRIPWGSLRLAVAEVVAIERTTEELIPLPDLRLPPDDEEP